MAKRTVTLNTIYEIFNINAEIHTHSFFRCSVNFTCCHMNASALPPPVSAVHHATPAPQLQP